MFRHCYLIKHYSLSGIGFNILNPIVKEMPMKRKKEEKRAETGDTDAITLAVNGEVYRMRIGRNAGEVAPHHTLALTLRETLNLTGTKVGL